VGVGKWTGEQRWVAALALAATLVLIGLLGLPLGPLRVVAGILTVFFAPGYALLLIIQPRQLATLGRVVFSAPLSLALAIACGIVLNRTPFGVYPEGLAAGAAILALAFFAAAAFLKRGGVPMPGTIDRDSWWRATAGRSRRRELQPLPIRLLVASTLAFILLAVWAGTGLYLGTRELPTHFTEFYYLAAAPADGGGTTLRFGIRNKEGATKRYLVRATRDNNPEEPAAGTPTPAPGKSTVLVAEREVSVGDGMEGVAELQLNLTCGDEVDATLHMAGDASASVAYRTVRIRPACAPGVTPSATPR
jgi:hypothetical protein